MNKERINILIASDINYAPYYGVMLTSLFAKNSDSAFDVYLITDETWTESETRKFEQLCAEHQSRFIVEVVDAAHLNSLPKTGHINRATYFNLNAANILPKDVHKVIYLDGDMIVCGNIAKLWQLDMSDYACAMVEDCLANDPSIYSRLEYPTEDKYFNNGVTVYNLDYLREMDFPSKALQFIIENPQKAYWMDQDAINVLLANKTLHLPIEYNFQTWFLLNSHWRDYSDEYKKVILKAAAKPIVVHYIGGTKPWYFRYFGYAYYNEWEKYMRMSKWAIRGSKRPIIKYIKYMVKRYFVPSIMKKQITQMWHIEDSIKQYFWT